MAAPTRQMRYCGLLAEGRLEFLGLISPQLHTKAGKVLLSKQSIAIIYLLTLLIHNDSL